MPQFFTGQKLTAGHSVELRGADARHISQSLRLGPGDWIVLSDGCGRSFRATITDNAPLSVTVSIGDELRRRETGPSPVLAMASIRAERLEWAVQKSVELGCRRIILFHSKRTVRAGGSKPKMDRLSKIALEAAKQSGLPFLPEIEGPIDFSRLALRLEEFSLRLMFYEGEGQAGLRKALRNALPSGQAGDRRSPIIIIGPEGGFATDEVDEARSHGAITVSLGQQILRAETAAVAAVSICQYELGNMELG